MIPSRKSSTVFCAVCGTERETPKAKSRVLNLLLKSATWSMFCGLFAYLVSDVMLAVWVSLLSGVLCFLALEVYDSVKFKRELVCPVCRFDPLLYRRSPEQAKQRCLESLKVREDILLRKWQAMKQVAEGGRSAET